MRGLHRRDRLPPGRRAAGGGHVRHGAHRGARALLKRFASRVVLAFDADAAGQGAAERFYEWEQKYQVRSAWPRFPTGQDPGELACRDPDGAARGGRPAPAVPRLPAAAGARAASRCAPPRSARAWPSRRWRWSTSTPTPTCASCTPAQVASSHRAAGRRPGGDRRSGARRGPIVRVAAARRVGSAENAEFVAIALLAAALGRRSPVADRGAVRRRGRTGARSSPSPRPTATVDAVARARRSRGRASCSNAPRSPTSTPIPAVEAPQPDRAAVRRELAPRRRRDRSRSRSVPTATRGVQLERSDDADRRARCSGAVARWLANGATRSVM